MARCDGDAEDMEREFESAQRSNAELSVALEPAPPEQIAWPR